jgi:hypothetical protein
MNDIYHNVVAYHPAVCVQMVAWLPGCHNHCSFSHVCSVLLCVGYTRCNNLVTNYAITSVGRLE